MTTQFISYAIPSLPGASGLPVISASRIALRDDNGALVGYQEQVSLQSNTVISLWADFQTMGGVDLSKKVDFILTYDASGTLLGGTMLHNDRAYVVQATGAINEIASYKPITLSNYSPFSGSDFVGAGAEGGAAGLTQASRQVMAGPLSFIANRLEPADLTAAALASDTKAVKIEGAGIVGGIGGAAIGTGIAGRLGFGAPLTAFAIGVGVFLGNQGAKAAGDSLKSARLMRS